MSGQRTKVADFSFRLGAVISGAIVVFLLAFRPFGLVIATLDEALVVLGLAPINLALLALIHQAPLPRGPARAVVAAAVVAAANAAYLSLFSANQPLLVIEAGLVGAAVLFVVRLWRRQHHLSHEVIDLRNHLANSNPREIVFRGESESEILKLQPEALRIAKAEANYVRIIWCSGDEIKETLLRTTLKDIEAAAGDAFIRSHRSYLINLGQAERLEGDSRGFTAHLSGGLTAPVSRSFIKAIKLAATA